MISDISGDSIKKIRSADLTQNQKELIVGLYQEARLSCGEIENATGIPVDVCLYQLRKHGVPRRSKRESNRSYIVQHDIFDSIDTEEKAYWVGFLAADGGVNDQDCLSLELARADGHHVETFNRFMNSDYLIKPSSKGCVRLQITSDQICRALAQNFIVPRKTFRTRIPLLSKELIRHFIRGVFDGDGWVSSRLSRNSKGKNKGRPVASGRRTFEVCFSGGCETFMNELRDILSQITGFRGSLNYRKNKRYGHAWTLSFGGNRQVKKIYHYFYDGASVWLPRKRDLIRHLGGTHE